MDTATKLVWLKRLLIVKILVVLLVWGLPSLLGNASLLKLFGVDMPPDPFFLRIFGATQVGLALLYWFAYTDPPRNRDIIKYAIFDNAVATLAILLVGLRLLSPIGLASPMLWVSGALTLTFTVLFWLLLPPKE